MSSTVPNAPSVPAGQSSSDLPPKRRGKATRHDVSKPLSNVRLPHLVNALALFALALAVFYGWRITKYKAQVGGWWNLISGTPRPLGQHQQQGGKGKGGFGAGVDAAGSGNAREVQLENHIHQIASILSIHPTDIASALSGALHTHAAPASVSSISSSISAQASAKGAAPSAAQIVFDTPTPPSNDGQGNGNGNEGESAAGMLAKAMMGVDDEPGPF